MDRLEGIFNIVSWLNFYILGSFALSISLILAIIFKNKLINFFQMEIPLKYYPFTMIALTLIHAFLALKIIHKVNDIFPSIQNFRGEAWNKIIDSEYFILNGMEPRRFYSDGGILGEGGYQTFSIDLTFFATFIFSITIVISIYLSLGLWRKFNNNNLITVYIKFSIACTFASINWIIGSQWAIAISKIAPDLS